MYKDGKEYEKFILNGKTYDKFYLNNKQYGGGYVPFATPILDLDFQNNFIDKSPSALTMVQGQGLPTFGLSGRKAGEYCVNFNGSQSIKTTTNLPLNSDKVCVKFWMKTSQTTLGILTEMGNGTGNVFQSNLNNQSRKIFLLDEVNSSKRNGGGSLSELGNWQHIILIIDRSLGANQNKIFVDGNIDYSQVGTMVFNHTGNFTNNILHIGQREGNLLGFNGSLMKYQAFRAVPTDAQAMEMYQNDL